LVPGNRGKPRTLFNYEVFSFHVPLSSDDILIRTGSATSAAGHSVVAPPSADINCRRPMPIAI
jgi:hypothetical protein